MGSSYSHSYDSCDSWTLKGGAGGEYGWAFFLRVLRALRGESFFPVTPTFASRLLSGVARRAKTDRICRAK